MTCEKTLRLLSFPLPSAVCSSLEGLLREDVVWSPPARSSQSNGERDLMGMACHEKNLAWPCVTDSMWKGSGGGVL